MVNAWLGHTEDVARKHYAQLTEDHYRRAVHNAVHDPVQNGAAGDSQGAAGQAEPEPVHAGSAAVSHADCGGLRDDAARFGENGASPCKGKELQSLTPRGFEPLLPG